MSIEGVLLGVCGLLIAACIVGGVMAVRESNREETQWAAFAPVHHCKLVGRIKGDLLVSPVISSKGGVAITATPDKAGWLCDDGITYWRDR
jgi:hypothetical protein